jgi:hypothetical protein
VIDFYSEFGTEKIEDTKTGYSEEERTTESHIEHDIFVK